LMSSTFIESGEGGRKNERYQRSRKKGWEE
jgi:hypothetical protein